jgi:hypothetical protein
MWRTLSACSVHTRVNVWIFAAYLCSQECVRYGLYREDIHCLVETRDRIVALCRRIFVGDVAAVA